MENQVGREGQRRLCTVKRSRRRGKGLGEKGSSVQLKVQGFGLEGTLVVVSARPCGPTPTLVPE